MEQQEDGGAAASSRTTTSRRRRRREEPKVWDAFRQAWVAADAEEAEEAPEEAKAWVPLKVRLQREKDERKRRRQKIEDAPQDEPPSEQQREEDVSLVAATALFKKELEAKNEDFDAFRRRQEEERMTLEAQYAQTNALQSAKEVATEKKWDRPLETQWRPSSKKAIKPEKAEAIRKKWCVLVDGEDVPAPITHFKDMNLPEGVLEALEARKITKPTPIQVQGLPVALSGRDMIGIAFTGSGKTLTFALPLITRALEQDRLVAPGRGPVGVVLCPSRELARQTFEVLDHYAAAVKRRDVRVAVAVGGEDKRAQLSLAKRRGVHGLVATPGRLIDFLERGDLSLRDCEYFCLDEGDRMLDLGFDEDVKKVMNFFSPEKQRQTLLFSATMPQKFRDFARATLVKPVVVNVSRAGAANLDVIQEVEYVKAEARIVYLLECLQKTPPPVVVFSEKKQEVDDVHEYLLLKGVDAVAVHGGKDQHERNAAIASFKAGDNDVLVATDVAAKGLDFPDIKHVINFDMPQEIEQYVHRIGRTGRSGKTGVATTFINKNCDQTALLDLKLLLVEAKQRVPPVLQVLQGPPTPLTGSSGGCAFCGGLGHTILDCPKRDKDSRKITNSRRDFLTSGKERAGPAEY